MSITDKLGAIPEILQKVYEAGKAAGGDGTDVYENGYSDGQQAEYARFWDLYQENGNRTDYQYAFTGIGWTNETFKPKYGIKPINAYYLFRSCNINGDLVDLLETCGGSLDFSMTTNVQFAFAGSSFNRIGVIDTRRANALAYMLTSAASLVTVDRIILKEDGSQTFVSTFGGLASLENIRFDGVIGQDMSISDSPMLSRESQLNIIEHLKDLTGSGVTRTLTLGETNLAKLTDAEKAIATEKGWVLA